jgi:polyisoprenoid-binding protein YceI
MLHKFLRAATFGLMLAGLAVATAGRGLTELAVDAAESHVTILVGKAGVLSFAGHAHEVVAPVVRGTVEFDPADWPRARVSLEIDAAALRVTGKNEAANDVPVVQQTMLSDKVLDVQRFSTITFRSKRVSVALDGARAAAVTIDGDMTLHGTTRPMTIRASATLDGSGRVTATGAFTLKQTDFGMVPVTAVGGTVRVKDDLDIQFVVKASPGHDTTGAR